MMDYNCCDHTEMKLLPLYASLIISLLLGSGWAIDNQVKFDSHGLQSTIEGIEQTEVLPQDIVQEMIDQVSQERVLTDLRRLTGVEPICIDGNCYTITGRNTGSTGLQWAKDYVYNELVSAHYSVEVQNWSREGHEDQNLIVRKQGIRLLNEEIYFIAHLDGNLDNNPAADDDASGAVSLLELARILSTRYLSRTVVLIFSTGEERGALGARSYIDQLTTDELNAIKYVVSVEMLGFDSNDDGKMQLWSGDQPTDFVLLLSNIINGYQLGLIPQIVEGCG